jgi:uncharacterized phiE125 gp8 family phage protein
MEGFLEILSTGAVFPLSLAEAKKHLRVEHTEDDSAISQAIDAAFDMVERRTGRAYRELSACLHLQGFPGGSDPIYLPRPPVVSIVSIVWKDTGNVAHTLPANAYQVLTAAMPGQILPTVGTSWPEALSRPQSVSIEFRAGTSNCPAIVLQAVKLFLDLEYHEHDAMRATRIENRIESLIAGHVLRDRNLIGLQG